MTSLPFRPPAGPPPPPPTSFRSVQCELMGICSPTDAHQTARASPERCPCDRKPGDAAQSQSGQGLCPPGSVLFCRLCCPAGLCLAICTNADPPWGAPGPGSAVALGGSLCPPQGPQGPSGDGDAHLRSVVHHAVSLSPSHQPPQQRARPGRQENLVSHQVPPAQRRAAGRRVAVPGPPAGRSSHTSVLSLRRAGGSSVLTAPSGDPRGPWGGWPEGYLVIQVAPLRFAVDSLKANC